MAEGLSNISTLNVNKMVELLASAYISLIQARQPFRNFPSIMLWGAPGVGKSQGIREVASRIERKTGKKVVITDVRLLLFNPVDLRGIPTSNENRTLAVWLKPKIFQMDESEDVVNILFLDEISAAPQSIQAAAYQITLDRTVGEHKLPENCIVIAAGNRVTDRSVAYNMPKALANRLCHLEIQGDHTSWHDWAVKKGIHRYVVGYLDFNPNALMHFEPSGTTLAFPTPRSWELASNILTNVSEDMELVYPLITGCIGLSEADSFREWTKLYKSIPSPEKIFQGQDIEKPKSPELRIALQSAMTDYAKKHPEETGISHSIDYACTLPFEFRNRLMHDYSLIPEVMEGAKANTTFRVALSRKLI